MPLWSGSLTVPSELAPLKDLRISAPPHLTIPSTLISKRSQLSFLGYISPSCIPLWMTAGPPLDVFTTSAETEAFFQKILCSTISIGEDFDEEKCIEQSSIGILVKVRESQDDGDGSATESSEAPAVGDWSLTEILFYGALTTTEVNLPDTPPPSSPVGNPLESTQNTSQPPNSSFKTRITTLTVHALPLSSSHNYSAALSIKREPIESTPTDNLRNLLATPSANRISAQVAHFIAPNPLDSPQISKSVKKRRADALSRAVENRKKRRFLSVSAAPSSRASSKIPPPLTLLSGTEAKRGARNTNEPSVGRGCLRERENSVVPSARSPKIDPKVEFGLGRHLDRSSSPEKRPCTSASSASFSSTKYIKTERGREREDTTFEDGSYPKSMSRPGTSAHSRRGSLPMTAITGAFDIEKGKEMDPVEAKNRDVLSRTIMNQMKNYGLKRVYAHKPEDQQGDSKDMSSCSSAKTDKERNKKDAEEYKYVYHNTMKAAAFALRNSITTENLTPQTTLVVVDQLLALFCHPPTVSAPVTDLEKVKRERE